MKYILVTEALYGFIKSLDNRLTTNEVLSRYVKGAIFTNVTSMKMV